MEMMERTQKERLCKEEEEKCRTKTVESGEGIPKSLDLLLHWQLNGLCHQWCHHHLMFSISTRHPLYPDGGAQYFKVSSSIAGDSI